jgi:L-serine deaminase
MSEKDFSDEVHPPEIYLRQIARDMRTIKQQLGKVIYYMVEAESEVSEKMRRFIMYFHDVHDIMWAYVEQGQEPPEYLKKEAMRCDDRYRQLLKEAHTDDGVFEKVRREMAKDEDNRWDHTKRLFGPSVGG